MVKQTMIRNYRKYTAAQEYIVGFEYSGSVYMVKVPDIAPRYMRVEHESSKKGGKAKLQLRLPNKYKKQLMRKYEAICLGDTSVISGSYNKGVMFEKVVTEYYGQDWRGKDSVPFYIAGDINIDGMEIQIKFNGAQIVVESTLEKLKKAA